MYCLSKAHHSLLVFRATSALYLETTLNSKTNNKSYIKVKNRALNREQKRTLVYCMRAETKSSGVLFKYSYECAHRAAKFFSLLCLYGNDYENTTNWFWSYKFILANRQTHKYTQKYAIRKMRTNDYLPKCFT